MIGRIHGEIIEKTPGHVLVDCSGIGYEIDIPYTTFFVLPETGHDVILHTHLAVREDAQNLFGFAERLDRDLFRLLIRVNGVGPKMALAILSALDAGRFVHCVESRDLKALVKVPGVGKKTAERLLIEMGDRLGQLEGKPDITASGSAPSAQGSSRPLDEAEAALVTLGYKPQEAARAINSIAEQGMTSETLIRLALKNMISVG